MGIHRYTFFDRFFVDHYNLEDECWDVHVLSGSLKLFFRELKEPLFTFNLFDRFIPALSKEKNSDRLKAARELIKTLPNYNYETLKFLLAHLCKVIDHSKENRMQVHNVAIVFGPTLIWPETVTPNLAANMIYQSRIVEYCLLEYKNIFRWRFAKKKIANHSVITSCTCIIQQRKKNQTWTILLTQHIFFFPSVQLLPTEYGKMRAKKKGIEW